MAKTTTELAIRVLQDLGRLPDEQIPTAAQKRKVTDAYSGVYASLLNDGLVIWAETDNIPEYAYQSIITLLKAQLAESFGNDPTLFLAQVNSARKKIAEQLAPPYEPQPTTFGNI